jgi:hypothetical protein
VQTFLPATDFVEVARVLDNQRLNKQALEGWQIMMTNLSLDPQGNYREPKGWRNHPAVKMWRGHEYALAYYIDVMVDEWKRRGYKSTIADKAWATYDHALSRGLVGTTDLPSWFLDEGLVKEITSSHRSALLSKNYSWYSKFGWQEDVGVAPSTYEYVWANFGN